MQTALARKPEESKSHPAPEPREVPELPPETVAGARAGTPLFLRKVAAVPPPGSPRLPVSQPTDPYEVEADRAAEAAVRGTSSAVPVSRLAPAAPIQRKCAACASGGGTCSRCAEEEERSTVQTKAQGGGRGLRSLPARDLQAPDSGSPLPGQVRRRVEPVLGSDLRHVRVHASPSARSQAAGLEARAFTHKSHIWLGPGESIDDTELMAHELAHVLQQAGAPPVEQPPPSGLGSRISRAYGRDVSGARFHLDSPLPRSLGKDAVTVGDHVSFAPGSYRPGVGAGDRLIAHELAHVAQQRGGTGGGEAAPPAAPSLAAAEVEATFAADTALAGGAVRQLSAVPGQPAQGGVLDDALGGIAAGASAAYEAGADAASAAYETGAELVEEGLDWAIEQFWDIVRAVFPEAEPYLRNPALLWQKIADWVMEGFDSLMSGIFSAFEEGGIFGGLGEFFEGLSVSIEGILAGLAEGDCGPLFAALQSAVDAFLQFAEPVLGPAKALFDSISAGLGGVFDMVVAPVLDLLKDVGGAAWEWLTGLVDSIVEIAGEVKDLAGVAWDFMKDLLGLSGDDSSSSGIWNWIRDSVGALWEEVKPTLMGWVEPLKTVAGVLIAFSPVGPIFLAFRYGPRLVRWLIELWNTLSDPQNLVAAREYVTGTLLPGAMAFLEEMAGQLNSVAAGVAEALRSLSGPLADLVAAFDAVSFLKTVASAVSHFAELVQEGITWAGETLGSFFASITHFLQGLWAWLKPVLGVLLKIVFIVGNPLGIPLLIASYVWRAIPDCIKKPIIGFILDLLIKFIDKLPDLAGAGLLWPMVKHGVLGFLREIRGQGDAGLDRAVAASNRIALLLTGPVDFLLGIGKGLLTGIWDGLVGPFELVWLLLKAQVRVAEFFESVSNDFSPHFQSLIGSLADIGSYVRDNFWVAVESAFGSEGGEGSPLDRVMSALGRAWDAVTGAAGSVGAAIAGGLISYLFLGDFELGDKLGYVAGLVIFEVALAILTAGVSAELKFFETTFGQVLRLLVRANEALGAVFGQILKIIPGLESALTRLFTMLGDAPIIRQLVARFRTFFTHLEELSLAGMRRYGGEFATAGAGATGRVIGGHADETARILGPADDATARTVASQTDEAVERLASGQSDDIAGALKQSDDAAARAAGQADEIGHPIGLGDEAAETGAHAPGRVADENLPLGRSAVPEEGLAPAVQDARQTIHNAVCGLCFPAGTKILTQDGYKNIESIQVGDYVLARDEHSLARSAYRRVKQTFQNPSNALLEIAIGAQRIRTTPGHVWWMVGGGWRFANDLNPGDEVLTSLGTHEKIIEIRFIPGFELTYNFEVDEFHTYFVAAEEGDPGILVHNASVGVRVLRPNQVYQLIMPSIVITDRRMIRRVVGASLLAKGSYHTELSGLFSYLRRGGGAGYQGVTGEAIDQLEVIMRNLGTKGGGVVAAVDIERIGAQRVFDLADPAVLNMMMEEYPRFHKFFRRLSSEGVVAVRGSVPAAAVQSLVNIPEGLSEMEKRALLSELITPCR